MINTASCFIDVLFVLLCFQRESQQTFRDKRLSFKLLWVLLLVPMYITPLRFLFSAAGRVLYRGFIYYGYLRFFEQFSRKGAAYAAFFWCSAFTLSQNIYLESFFNTIFHGDVRLFASSFLNILLCAVLVAAIRAAFYLVIAHAAPIESMDQADWTHILFAVFITIVSTYLKHTGYSMLNAAGDSQIETYFIILLFALLCLLLFYDYNRRWTQEHTAAQLQNTVAQALLDNLQSKQQAGEDLRQLRHDLKNHMLTLDLLLKQGDIDGAAQHINVFLEQLPSASTFYQTGCDLLDGLLYQKLAAAPNQQIQVDLSVDFSTGTFISSFDLCVLMGNILDNAIEACLQVQPLEKRFIRLRANHSANFLLIYLENSCIESPDRVNGLPRTTKADSHLHGYGLRSVRNVLRKYNGNLTFRCDDPSRFVLSILIPLPDPPAAEGGSPPSDR